MKKTFAILFVLAMILGCNQDDSANSTGPNARHEETIDIDLHALSYYLNHHRWQSRNADTIYSGTFTEVRVQTLSDLGKAFFKDVDTSAFAWDTVIIDGSMESGIFIKSKFVPKGWTYMAINPRRHTCSDSDSTNWISRIGMEYSGGSPDLFPEYRATYCLLQTTETADQISYLGPMVIWRFIPGKGFMLFPYWSEFVQGTFRLTYW